MDIETSGIILSKQRKNKGANQTAGMRRLICGFVVRIWHKTGFLMTWLISCIHSTMLLHVLSLQDNSSLQILKMSWNGFYLEGCRSMVRTLQLNTTLEVLDLSNNRINRECLGHLVKGLAKNTTLHTLIVSY